MGAVENEIMSLFKKTQPRLIVNQHVSKICIVVEKNKETKNTKTIIINLRNLFRPKIENQAIKGRIIRDIKNFEQGCHKPVRVGSFYSNSYIEYDSNGRYKTLIHDI